MSFRFPITMFIHFSLEVWHVYELHGIILQLGVSILADY